jgi:aminomethyltransferase
MGNIEVTLTDLEGLQPCEILAARPDGQIDLGILGAHPNTEPEGLRAILSGEGEPALGLHAALRRRGVKLGSARCLRIFGSASPMGATERFVAARSGVLIVVAPGGRMDAELQDTATDIEVRIARARL